MRLQVYISYTHTRIKLSYICLRKHQRKESNTECIGSRTLYLTVLGGMMASHAIAEVIFWLKNKSLGHIWQSNYCDYCDFSDRMKYHHGRNILAWMCKSFLLQRVKCVQVLEPIGHNTCILDRSHLFKKQFMLTFGLSFGAFPLINGQSGTWALGRFSPRLGKSWVKQLFFGVYRGLCVFLKLCLVDWGKKFHLYD